MQKASEQVWGTISFRNAMPSVLFFPGRILSKLIKFQHYVSNQTKPNQIKPNQTKPNQKYFQKLSSGMPHPSVRSSACNFSESASHAVSRKMICDTTIQILDFGSAVWPKTELTRIFVDLVSVSFRREEK